MPIFASLMELFELAKVIDPVFGKVGEAIFDKVTDVCASLTSLLNVEADLDKLRRTVARIQALLKDAEESRVIQDSSVLLWLAGLKDVAMDAEDVIDEFETYINIQKAAAGGGASSSRKRKRQWLSFKRPAWIRKWKISGKIKEIQEMYDENAEARDRLQLRESDGQRRQQDNGEEKLPRAAASLQGNSLVLGIDEKILQIIDLLKQEDSIVTGAEGTGESNVYADATAVGTGSIAVPASGAESSSGMSSGTRNIYAPTVGTRNTSAQNAGVRSNGTLNIDAIATDGRAMLPVIAIVGAGGIGKTTLARQVFDSPDVESYTKIWIGVTREFDEYRITKEIVESIQKSSCEALSLDLLQRQLEELIREKKFLLVLDGIWSENQYFWETIIAPLIRSGARGSVILATAQSELALRYARTLATIRLTGLGEVDSWTLFCNHAFEQGVQDAHLEAKGKAIVGKCHGSPLAIISIGGMLYGVRDEQEWTNVLNDMPDCEDAMQNILLTLKVSYDHLPYHLKQCFTFCSIFPNGYEFDKEELVRIWIAVGLVKRRGRTMTPEYVGYKYFEYLLWRSFFQTSVSHENTHQKYKMPGLIHELGQNVFGIECLRIEKDAEPSEQSRSSRYALLYDCSMEDEFLWKINQHERLRALVLLSSQSNVSTKQVPDDFFQNFKCLRALDLRNHHLKEVPSSIGDLIHLRYLNLYGTPINRLPDSLCNLYNLQMLELGDCKDLLELPEDLSNLINLRYLGLHLDWEKYINNWNDIELPPGISRLSHLRTFSRFSVSSKSECSIKEIKKLDLRGEICISKLENTTDANDAKEADIKGKRYLENMMLRWTSSPNPHNGVQEEVIENLCPSTKIKTLWIMNYPGNGFPKWLEDQSLNIETLRLSNCENCERFPLLGKLPKLKVLYLEGLDSVKHLDTVQYNGNIAGFPSLEILTVSNMFNLESWFDPFDAHRMPRLRKLHILDCHKLSGTIQIPNSHEVHYEVTNCPNFSIISDAS